MCQSVIEFAEFSGNMRSLAVLYVQNMTRQAQSGGKVTLGRLLKAALPVVKARRAAALVLVFPGLIVPDSSSKIEAVIEPIFTQKHAATT